MPPDGWTLGPFQGQVRPASAPFSTINNGGNSVFQKLARHALSSAIHAGRASLTAWAKDQINQPIALDFLNGRACAEVCGEVSAAI
jgi:hypothetical protein